MHISQPLHLTSSLKEIQELSPNSVLVNRMPLFKLTRNVSNRNHFTALYN